MANPIHTRFVILEHSAPHTPVAFQNDPANWPYYKTLAKVGTRQERQQLDGSSVICYMAFNPDVAAVNAFYEEFKDRVDAFREAQEKSFTEANIRFYRETDQTTCTSYKEALEKAGALMRKYSEEWGAAL